MDERTQRILDAYAEGQKAYWSDAPVTLKDNPYPHNTAEHVAWRNGYVETHEAASE